MDSSRKPRCTVIVLNFNGEHLLPACLDSLAAQSGTNIDTVVIDNASTDGSADLVAQKYPWVRFIRLEKNSGFSIANNLAIRDALERGSDYVLLLNNDNFAAPDFVSEMLAIIEADSSIAVVSPKIFFAHRPDRLWYEAVTLAFGPVRRAIAVGRRLTWVNSTTCRVLPKPRAARC